MYTSYVFILWSNSRLYTQVDLDRLVKPELMGKYLYNI